MVPEDFPGMCKTTQLIFRLQKAPSDILRGVLSSKLLMWAQRSNKLRSVRLTNEKLRRLGKRNKPFSILALLNKYSECIWLFLFMLYA